MLTAALLWNLLGLHERRLMLSPFYDIQKAAGMDQYKHLLEDAAKYSKGDLALAMVRYQDFLAWCDPIRLPFTPFLVVTGQSSRQLWSRNYQDCPWICLNRSRRSLVI